MHVIRDAAEQCPRRAGRARRRYGLLVIVEADSPRGARECVAVPLLFAAPSAAGEAIWVGSPREGIPLAAEEFGEESLALSFDLPDGAAGPVRMAVRLRGE
jgi:hypothetical protein